MCPPVVIWHLYCGRGKVKARRPKDHIPDRTLVADARHIPELDKDATAAKGWGSRGEGNPGGTVSSPPAALYDRLRASEPVEKVYLTIKGVFGS